MVIRANRLMTRDVKGIWYQSKLDTCLVSIYGSGSGLHVSGNVVDDDDLYRPALAPKGLYLYYLITLHTFHPVPPKSPSIVLLQFVL